MLNIENIADLKAYITSRQLDWPLKEIKIIPLSGGVSNRTVLLEFPGGSWVLKQALTKLRVKGDWYSPPERIFFESEALQWFNDHIPGSCPKLVFLDQSQYLLAMEAIQEPFKNLKTVLLSGQPERWYFKSAGKLLGKIHALGMEKVSIPPRLFDKQFFNSLRIEPYYQETIRQLPQAKSFLKQLIEDTDQDEHTLVHGDFSPKNLLVKKQQLVLLDHEVAHFGDGTFDLGFFFTHLLSKAVHRHEFHRSFIKGVQECFDAYGKEYELTKEREQRAVRHTLGCLLARIYGLSPLEYLNPQQQKIQSEIAVNLIGNSPSTIKELTSAFQSYLDT